MFVHFLNNSSVINLTYLKQLVLISVANSQILDQTGSVWQWQKLLFYQSKILIKAVKRVGFLHLAKIKLQQKCILILEDMVQDSHEIIILSFRNYFLRS